MERLSDGLFEESSVVGVRRGEEDSLRTESFSHKILSEQKDGMSSCGSPLVELRSRRDQRAPSPLAETRTHLVRLHVKHCNQLSLKRNRRLKMDKSLLEVLITLSQEVGLGFLHLARIADVAPNAVEEDHGHAGASSKVRSRCDVVHALSDNLAHGLGDRAEKSIVPGDICDRRSAVCFLRDEPETHREVQW